MGGIDKGLQLLKGKALWRHVADALQPQVKKLVISANRNLDCWRSSGYREPLPPASTTPVMTLPCILISPLSLWDCPC